MKNYSDSNNAKVKQKKHRTKLLKDKELFRQKPSVLCEYCLRAQTFTLINQPSKVQFAQIIFQASPDNYTCTGSEGSIQKLTFVFFFKFSSVKKSFYRDKEWGQCVRNCSEYEYSFYLFDETVDSEFDLICENDFKSSVISSLSIFGLFLGAVSFGYIADRIGRRNALIIASTGCLVFSLLTSLVSPNLWLYTSKITSELYSGVTTVRLVYRTL